MTHIGTEKLPLFTGAQLKEQALSQHASDRAHDIQKVRVALLAGARMAESRFLTADDASVVVERLGMSTGKWLGTIFRHWDAVEPTGQFIKSTLPRSRARRIAVWAIK